MGRLARMALLRSLLIAFPPMAVNLRAHRLPAQSLIHNCSAREKTLAQRCYTSNRSFVSSLRLVLGLVLATIFAFLTVGAHGQVPTGRIFNGETATPIPGGHDYIPLAAETVNPSKGSVSINFNLRMPEGPGSRSLRPPQTKYGRVG
jgi:hypothetical protein